MSGRPKQGSELSSDHGLSAAELVRYQRHLVLPEVGLEGQGR